MKRSNVFQEENDTSCKKPVLRDPRKLKFIAASMPKTVHKVVEKEESNTLKIQNISNSFSELMICQIFCAYGSIYSCRVLHDQDVAYVAFTNAQSAKYAMDNLNGKIFNERAIELSFASKILCVGQVLLEADLAEQMTGLPFNAQYEIVSGIFDNSGQKTKVVVKIPTADLCTLIHQTVQLVLKNGPEFEEQLIKREKGNPKYEFLTNCYSAEHAYYRWKVFSQRNGDLPNWWKCQPFVMFEGGPTWIPPRIPFEEEVSRVYLTQKKPDYPQVFEYDSSASETSDSGSDFEDRKKKKYSSKQSQMSLYHRVCFEDKLRNLTTYRGDIAEAMIFCMRHSYAAEELANLISDSLRIPETVVYPTKLARLYLLSDILFKYDFLLNI